MIRDEYKMRLDLWSDIQDHLPRLYSEAATGHCVIIELGVRAGNSTAAFLAAPPPRGAPGTTTRARAC